MDWNTQTYTGWGNALSSTTQIARPERHAALANLIRDCDRILPVGNRRSYGDAALAADGRALQTGRLNRLLAFDTETGVLEAEAGITLGEILRLFAPRGWMPAVLPGTGMTTLGGAIANDIHGKNHHVAGSFGQHVKSFTLLTADGQARKLTAETGGDLFRATIGGVGQTGLITCAEIQLAPCAGSQMDVTEVRIPDLEAFIDAFERSTSPYQVGWIDALATGTAMGRGIFEEAVFSNEPTARHRDKPPASLPLTPPGIAVAAPVVRLFNALYFRHVPQGGRTVTRPLEKFFFPLDRVSDWNRLYGKNGFFQFQCVLPLDNAAAGLSELLTTVSEGGIASPLAVLKKMGVGRAGMMSFPMEGYTLAIDMPNRSATAAILAELAALTEQFGGRVYLAKDGAASPHTIAQMYPELAEFRAAVKDIDPKGKFVSQMAERLDLRAAS